MFKWKYWVLFLTGLALGLTPYLTIRGTPQNPRLLALPDAPAEAEVAQGEKVVTRQVFIIRLYAADGSFVEPSVTEWIDTKLGDDFDSGRWQRDSFVPYNNPNDTAVRP